MNKDRKKAVLKAALKGKTAKVSVVNTPTVKLAHDEPKSMPPTLRLSTDELPEIKKWKVGDTYKLIVEVEQKSMRQGNEYELETDGDEGKVSATFEIKSVKAV